MSARLAASRRVLAGAVSFLLTGGVLLLVPAAARADSAPATPSPTTPVTAAADALPTVQTNDIV
ncbi:MAG: repeat-containing protein, partial [Frankiales bacterium]|nr:repeat-containing protein [Frankiales bacterium]